MEKIVLDAMKAASPLNFEKCGVIADKFGLKQRSVVASAIRNEIPYENKKRVSKSGDPVVSKGDLVEAIAENLDLDSSALSGLEKATKSALSAIATATTPEEDETEGDETEG